MLEADMTKATAKYERSSKGQQQTVLRYFLLFYEQFLSNLKKLDPGEKLLNKYFVEIPCISSPVKYNKHAPLKYIHKV